VDSNILYSSQLLALLFGCVCLRHNFSISGRRNQRRRKKAKKESLSIEKNFRKGTGGPSPLVPEDGYFCFEDIE
jgi:hypothetical protein